MNFEDYVEFYELIEPGITTRQIVESHRVDTRYMALSNLSKVDGKCAWCNSIEPKGRRRKYCSAACEHSADAYCFPQRNISKSYILRKQKWACAGCGESFEELFEKKLLRRIADYPGIDWTNPLNKLSPFWLSYCTGDTLQVDHIIALINGGRGIGFDNVQVLCSKCHGKKSGKDRKRQLEMCG